VYFVVPLPEWKSAACSCHFFSQSFDLVAVLSLGDIIRLFSAFLLCDLSVFLFHFFRIIRSVGCGANRFVCSLVAPRQ